MMREPKTVPIPAPDPATPTVAAPAPMNLAAVSISRAWAETASGLKTNSRPVSFSGKKNGNARFSSAKIA